MAKHIKDTIQILPTCRFKNKALKNKYTRYEIIISRHYIDMFGKEFKINNAWCDYATKELAEKQIDIDKQAMINCGYII
jgi:hypothetical protein